MYPVTKQFMDLMKADKRRVLARVTIDYTDPFIDQSITTVVSEENNISRPAQTADGIGDVLYKWASLDGSWVLDGTYHLAPPKDMQTQYQIGWWGAQLAGEDGAFADPYPTLIITHAPRPVHTLRVTGDSARYEWPTEFTIALYGADDTLLYSETVIQNAQVNWSRVLAAPVVGVVKQVLTVTRWSHPGRQAKIIEFFTSIQETYEGEALISLRLLEERETSLGGLPVGAISANEIEIALDNSDRRFDAENIQTPLANLLRPNRRIRAWLGAENGEWIPLGVFWSGDWSVSDNEIIARVRGWDWLEQLRHSKYYREGVRHNLSLYELAEDVLTDAGLTADEYWIADELREYIIPHLVLQPQSHREVLRQIAEACLGQVYCDRHGVIRIEGTKPIVEQYLVDVSESAVIARPEQITDGIEEPTARYASLDGSWVLDGTYALAPSPEQEGYQVGWWGETLAGADGTFSSPYPTLTLEYLTPKAVATVRIVGDIARGEYPVDFILRLYDAENTLLATRQMSGNDQVVADIDIPENPTTVAKIVLEIYRWSHPGRQAKILEMLDVPLRLKITPDDYFRKDTPAKYGEMANCIIVEYQPIDENGQQLPVGQIMLRDEQSIVEHGLLAYKLSANPLIQTAEMAQKIAERLLASFGDARRTLELDWRGNPALLLGDVVTVVDGRPNSRTQNYVIVRQEIEYAGALSAKLSGRRMI
ncbi:MAG TPA: hypothetical protein GXX51_12295 [Firmicutes bacterium]|nr:hypothetical protein [Bacillota bacterium]